MSAGALPTPENGGLPWRGFAAGGLALAAALGLSPAQAQSNPCAIYGSGFVSVHGGDTCVRIGGRVRLDAGVSASPSPQESGPGLNFAPAPTPFEGPARAHLRLQGGGSQSGMPRTR